MNLNTIAKLAEQGFLFSPTSMGMTRSDRIAWQDIATNDPSALRQWIAEGLNLVSVAKRGHGFFIDIDDIASAKAIDIYQSQSGRPLLVHFSKESLG
jgi:hypothetical protein